MSDNEASSSLVDEKSNRGQSPEEQSESIAGRKRASSVARLFRIGMD